MRGSRGIAAVFVAFVLLAVAAFANEAIGLPIYYLILFSTVLFWVTQSTSWNLLSGYAGYFSFGQGAYIGVGAYAMAVLTGRHGVNFLLSIVIGTALSAILAWITGAIAFRLKSLRGEIFALLTLAVPFILAAAAIISPSIDGGQGTTLPVPKFPGWVADFQHLLFYLNLIVAAISIGIAVWVTSSRLGRGLAAINDAEDAAEVMGVPTFRYKMFAIVIGGALGGMGGALFALQIGYVSTETIFNLTIPLTVIVISVLGGRRHWAGPIVGALIIVIVQDRLSSAGMTAWSPIVFGGLLAILVILAPDGMYPRLRAHPKVSLGALILVGAAGFAIPALSGTDALLCALLAAVVAATVASLLPSARMRKAPATAGAHAAGARAAAAAGAASPTEPAAGTASPAAPARPPAPPTAPPPDTRVVVECRDVVRHFGGVQALRGVTFSIRAGELVGLVGPNGSGKTTLMNLLSGALPVTSGAISITGTPTAGLAAHRIAHAGVARTYQIPRPFSSMSVRDNVATAIVFGRRAPNLAQARAEADTYLATVSLAEYGDALPEDLTLHQRLMLEIARAIAADPVVLLLDEALAGLNPAEIDEAVAVIRRIHAAGITIVVVEHLLRVLHQLATRIIVLNNGSVIADGEPAAVLADPEVVRAYLGRGQASPGAVTGPDTGADAVPAAARQEGGQDA
jgi:branched-chain amino acid transport system permease protein